ncbi:MAG: heavy-metal-associated domain-containing protein [Anaerolineaceae bacterium]|nr:heavy-metal-associated domain-containing protein [Anaerolineaceae bacterium]
MTRITLIIKDMECPNCAMILEGIEDKLPGIQRAEASYHKGLMVVDYNEAQVSEETIRGEVMRMGYDVGEV